jgi:ribonuclease J
MMLFESGTISSRSTAASCSRRRHAGDRLRHPGLLYLLAKRDHLRGVIVTHGHEDHIGALPYLLRELDVPVYGTRMALALATERLREHGLAEHARLVPVEPRQTFDLGPFRVEPIRVTHSVVDGVGYAIDTPVRDLPPQRRLQFDPARSTASADYHRLAELGERGVLCLMADSTNVDRPGTTPSEREVGRHLASASARRPAGSSGDVRLPYPPDPAGPRPGRRARAPGRPRAQHETNVRIASELGYLRVPEGA